MEIMIFLTILFGIMVILVGAYAPRRGNERHGRNRHGARTRHRDTSGEFSTRWPQFCKRNMRFCRIPHQCETDPIDKSPSKIQTIPAYQSHAAYNA